MFILTVVVVHTYNPESCDISTIDILGLWVGEGEVGGWLLMVVHTYNPESCDISTIDILGLWVGEVGGWLLMVVQLNQ